MLLCVHIATYLVVVGATLYKKSLRLFRLKSDLDEIWQEFSSHKCSSICCLPTSPPSACDVIASLKFANFSRNV